MQSSQYHASYESNHDRLVRQKRQLLTDMHRCRDQFKALASSYRDKCKQLDAEIKANWR